MVDHDKPHSAELLTNTERLQRHLKDDTLAARLVQAHAESGGSVVVLKEIIADRLDQVRRNLDQN